MAIEFHAVVAPPPSTVDRIAALTPENPFYTNEYLCSRKKLGAEPCSIELLDAGRPVTGCTAFITRGRLNSRMELTSLPTIVDETVFWNGLFGFCRSQEISILSVHTFASAETAIMKSKRRFSHKLRSEYRLDLTVTDLWAAMNRRSRRAVKTSREEGLEIRLADDAAFRRLHVEMANRSLDRLRERGEPIDSEIKADEVDALLDCGAGELIQAVRGEEVFGSLLIAKSAAGCYGQSSAVGDAGREIGCSHFLFFETACMVQSKGLSIFNLGGADDHNTGLQQFKSGLGARRVDLESAEFYTGGVLKKYVTKALSLMRRIG